MQISRVSRSVVRCTFVAAISLSINLVAEDLLMGGVEATVRCSHSNISLLRREQHAVDGRMAVHVHGMTCSDFVFVILFLLFVFFQIDHDATSSFFGYATAVSRAGHVLFAAVFALWAHRLGGIK